MLSFQYCIDFRNGKGPRPSGLSQLAPNGLIMGVAALAETGLLTGVPALAETGLSGRPTQDANLFWTLPPLLLVTGRFPRLHPGSEELTPQTAPDPTPPKIRSSLRRIQSPTTSCASDGVIVVDDRGGNRDGSMLAVDPARVRVSDMATHVKVAATAAARRRSIRICIFGNSSWIESTKSCIWPRYLTDASRSRLNCLGSTKFFMILRRP